MCFYCKGEMKPSTTSFKFQFEDSIIIIKNVPCEECTQCGETEISNAVMEQLEQIVNSAKHLAQEVAVIDYTHAA